MVATLAWQGKKAQDGKAEISKLRLMRHAPKCVSLLLDVAKVTTGTARNWEALSTCGNA